MRSPSGCFEPSETFSTHTQARSTYSTVKTITERAAVSQPNAFANGQTVAVPQSSISVQQTGGNMFKFEYGADLDEIVRAVNQVGASPGDLVAILEALKEAGALRAELVVI